MRLSNVVLEPIITEKTVSRSDEGIYAFKVAMKATKGSIEKKLKELYKVEVVDINTMILPGKPKRIIGTRRFTKTPKWKKAVVKLKEGQKIDIFPKE